MVSGPRGSLNSTAGIKEAIGGAVWPDFVALPRSSLKKKLNPSRFLCYLSSKHTRVLWAFWLPSILGEWKLFWFFIVSCPGPRCLHTNPARARTRSPAPQPPRTDTPGRTTEAFQEGEEAWPLTVQGIPLLGSTITPSSGVGAQPAWGGGGGAPGLLPPLFFSSRFFPIPPVLLLLPRPYLSPPPPCSFSSPTPSLPSCFASPTPSLPLPPPPSFGDTIMATHTMRRL